ncbi:hypothetical protein AAMO2058_000741800 [Amorphochlora amoebiformis]
MIRLCRFSKYDSVLFSFREAESSRETELRAAIRIQSFVRGCLSRKYVCMLNKRALEMQRLWRGHVSRKRVKRIQKEFLDHQNALYHNLMATKIQKIWRGYISRKNLYDFYKRKEYIRRVVEQGEEMMMQLNKQEERNLKEEKEKKGRKLAEKFASMTSNMHHLVSTSTQPGVFNAMGMKTMAFGAPLEEHIKHNHRQRYGNTISTNMRIIKSRQKESSQSLKANLHPFGSKSDRFSRITSTLTSEWDNGSGQYTWAASPSPVKSRKKGGAST